VVAPGSLERRGDLFEKRRKVMDDWAMFSAQPAPAGDNVRPIRAAGSGLLDVVRLGNHLDIFERSQTANGLGRCRAGRETAIRW
jgi:hypothetical protein